MKQARWAGSYADAAGRECISVEVSGNAVSAQIRGITFVGRALNDLAPVTALAADTSFTLYYEALCACTFDWTMPVSLDTPDGVREADMVCVLTLGEPPGRGGTYDENLSLSLSYDGADAATTGPHDLFETAIADLAAKLPPGVSLRACATCELSAYPPIRASEFFGGLACFRDNQATFLAAASTSDLHQIWHTRTEFVLETYLCPEFRRG
jgi:hypothetical protein